MSTTLATTNQWSGFGLEGFEELDQADFILPRWSIVQPTSRMDGAKKHIGEFARNIDGEFRESLDVVLLKVSPNRLLWGGEPGEFRADRKPECTSRDGILGSTYGECKTCQFNGQTHPQLYSDKTARICSYGYSLVIVDDVEQGTMALFGAMGTNVRPIRTLQTQIFQRKRPAYSALVHFETAETTNDRGSFFVLKPTISQWFEPSEVGVWQEMFNATRGSVIRDYEESVAGEDNPPPF